MPGRLSPVHNLPDRGDVALVGGGIAGRMLLPEDGSADGGTLAGLQVGRELLKWLRPADDLRQALEVAPEGGLQAARATEQPAVTSLRIPTPAAVGRVGDGLLVSCVRRRPPQLLRTGRGEVTGATA